MVRNCLFAIFLLLPSYHSILADGTPAQRETHEIKITNPELDTGDYVRGIYNVESKTVAIAYCKTATGPCSPLGPHSFYNLEELLELKQWYEELSQKGISIEVPILSAIAIATAVVVGVGKYWYGFSVIDFAKARIAAFSVATGIGVGGASLWVKDILNFVRHRVDFVLTYHSARALRYFTELDHITRDHTRNDISSKDFAVRLDGALRNLKQ